VSFVGGNASVGFPATVTVPAGATTAHFTVTSSGVNANTVVTLIGKLGTSSAQGAFTIVPPVLSNLTFSASTAQGGNGLTGTISLNGPAGSAGIVVKLTGGNGSVGFPATVTIPAGQSSATFSMTSSSVSANVIEKITATAGTVVRTVNVTITP
jgi:hypothetical protein